MKIFLPLLLSLTSVVTSFECPESVSSVCRCFSRHYFTSGRREERRYVDCSSRELFKAPFMNFPGNTHLWDLRLQNNSITSLTTAEFPNRIKINKIDISKNPIGRYLKEGVFSKIARDVHVVIAREIRLNLQDVTSLSFLKGAQSLLELDVSRNLEYGVENLPALFVDNSNDRLQKLSLSLCRIHKVHVHAFRGIDDLSEIDLSENYLTKVPRALSRLKSLTKLNLRENDISVIYHGDFSELPKLQWLDLSSNLLGQLESFRNGALFGVRHSLTHLYLHGSHLTFIPTTTLKDLKNLTHLDLSNNRISHMNNVSFHGRYNLVWLDVSDNPWLIDKDMFSGVQNSLLTLRMRKSGLNFIPSSLFTRLKVLRELDLSFNSLLTVESMAGISARRISLHGNKIRYISPRAFSHFKLPIDLDVSKNSLASLDFVFKADTCLFYKLNISNNGFLCDCTIEKLLNSGLTHTLAGDCVQKNGNAVSFRNQTMVAKLEQRCGRSPFSFCLWWVPKSGAVRGVSFTYRNVFVLLFISVVVSYVHV